MPPLVETAKQLKAKGVEVVSVIGFANKDAVILEDKLRACGEVYVTTDDGSYGIKGYVSTVIDGFDWTPDAVYSCGAPGMLKYVDSKFENHPHAYVSMELAWLVVWVLAMPVWFTLKESRTPKIFVFAKKDQSSLPEKSSSRRLPCQRLNQKIV